MSDGPFYLTEHEPNEVYWRPVTRRKVISTDQGDIIAKPGQHVELFEPASGVSWANEARDFIRRYRLDEKGKAIFRKYYPEARIP